MYAKIYASMYDGTLVEHWEALVTFQQLLILADPDGNVDVTHEALHRRTGIPMDVLRTGISILEGPDENSRSDAEEGRRITRIDEHRAWGWNIVNYRKYRLFRNAETVRENNRKRVAKYREKKKKERERNAYGNAVMRTSPQEEVEAEVLEPGGGASRDSVPDQAPANGQAPLLRELPSASGLSESDPQDQQQRQVAAALSARLLP